MPFQFFSVPVRQIRSSLGSALQKVEQCLPRRGGQANVVVHQQKLFQLRMIESRRGLNALLGKTGRLRCSISVEGGTFDFATAWPEPRADYFVRISFAGNDVGPGALGSTPPGEARHCQVEASPEKLHRTALADEAGTKFLEDVFAQNQYAPEAVRIFGIIRGMLRVEVTGPGVRHLDRHGPNSHFNAQGPQASHKCSVEVSHRLRLQG